ncbi:MAG: hypothetical protein FRX48_04620 [Lasallia pustulata]|uniref:Nuclear speckle splicing regulatory protein 1 N-terminal domain-containing protein n=1 Tax=Lasallia pustulata TaxID=136370 RepID=A0A1W5D8D8_9LECA|nr:MAG: hypothetical protein FRX48_04620 [Lasallia pustulata]SLM39376.1 Domain of unknown function DUF2040 [Lasallia pustulata]
MSALSYGLNITKKPPSLANRPAPAKRKTIFDDDSDPENEPDGNEDRTESISTIGGLRLSGHTKSSGRTKRPGPTSTTSSKPSPQISQYGDLAANHTSAKHAATAQNIDSSIYDYDAVYDSLHSKPAYSADSVDKRPKYMTNLLAAAETRKRDQLRAKEKMLAKEREAEGEEFADKEKFVTGAYRQQQEEVRRMEEEEQKREAEEAERRRRMGGGMTGLYKGILERDEQKHAEIIKAAEKLKATKGEAGLDREGDGSGKGKSEAELAKERGAVINDEGQVVDKRQLLSAGLNVAPKPRSSASSQSSADASAAASKAGAPAGLQGRDGSKQAMRERQSRMLEAQLEQASKRAADDEAVQQKELERAAKSRKTEGDISSARERYLQRKKEAAAAAAVAGNGS